MQQHPEDLLSSSGHVWHGVAIGWSKDLSGNIDLNIESSSDRIVGVKMKLANSSLLLLSFYAPTAGRDEEFLEAIACLTECLKSNVISGEHVIIGADANHNFYILSKKKRTICVKKYPLDGWMDELQTGPVGYMLKIPIG